MILVRHQLGTPKYFEFLEQREIVQEISYTDSEISDNAVSETVHRFG